MVGKVKEFDIESKLFVFEIGLEYVIRNPVQHKRLKSWTSAYTTAFFFWMNAHHHFLVNRMDSANFFFFWLQMDSAIWFLRKLHMPDGDEQFQVERNKLLDVSKANERQNIYIFLLGLPCCQPSDEIS